MRTPTESLTRAALLVLALGFLTHDACALSPQWTPVGPTYLTEGYNPSNQKNNGRIWNIAVDPSNTNHILIFSDSGGIWQTTNDGATWTPQTDDYPSFNVSYNNNSGAIAFCNGTPSIVYANTQPAEDGWGGVIHSTDGGSTWNEIASYNSILGTNYYTNMRDMLVDPANSNNVEFDCRYSWYVGPTWGNLGGVYKSTDGGSTWTNTLQGTIGIPGPCLVASSSNFSNQYFANGSNIGSNPTAGIFRSTDAGSTWASVSGPWSSVSGLSDLYVAIAPSDQNTVYVIAATGDYAYNPSGFYMTSNAWAATPTWVTLTAPISSPDGFKVNPTNSQLIYLNFYNYYCNSPCTDSWTNYETFNVANGTTSAWTEYYAANSPFHADGRDLCWQTNTSLLASSDGGIFRSTDSGNTFSDINEGGLQTMMIYGQSGSVQPGYPSNLVGGGTQDNGTQLYSGGGVFSESLAGGDGNSNQQDFFGDAAGALGTASNGTMYRSTNPNTWNNPSFYYTTTGQQVGSLTGIQATTRSYNNQNYVLAGASTTLYQATDFWSNPTSTSVVWNNITSSITPSGNIQYVEYARSDATNNTIAFTTANNQIWVTSNGGASWNGSDTSGLPNRNITQVTFDPTNANKLYVVFSGYDSTTPSGHIFVTANALAASPSWTSIDDGVDIPHNCIAVDPATPANLFVGTDIGMLYSTNSGTNWTAMNPATTGMPNVSVQELAFEKTTETLTAWTFGRGIFQMQINNYTATPTFTPTITPTFVACSSWVVNGNATQGAAVTMTTAANGQTSSAWNRTCINLTQNFNMTFKAYFGASTAGADGMDFVLQNDPRGTAAIGAGGGSKGYSGAGAITPSMAFCLETYGSNGTLQPQENGTTTSTCGYTTGGTCPYVFGSPIDNGVEHTYNVVWNAAGKVLTLYMDGVVVMTYDRDLVANVFGGSTCAYYGFTAATGGANNLQYFYQTNCFTDTPTPTTTYTLTVTPTYTTTNTATSTPTNPITSTFTNTATNTATQTMTNTSTNTATHTETNTVTNTATHTATHTSTMTSTNTATSTSTNSATSTATNTATHSATNTATNTNTNTATFTFTSTPTSTKTFTPTLTPTFTPTLTPTNTNTYTPSPTKTNTDTPTITNTPLDTATPTLTPTATPFRVSSPVVYPNPVTGPTVTVQLPGFNLNNVEVQIFTLAFRKVQTITAAQVAGNSLTVPLVDKSGVPLANGLYYFVIHVGTQKWIVKVLIIK